MDCQGTVAREGGASARNAVARATELLMGGELRTIDDFHRRASEIGRLPLTCPMQLGIATAVELLLVARARKLALTRFRL